MIIKSMNLQTVHGHIYLHPCFTSATVFFAELLGLLPYIIYTGCRSTNKEIIIQKPITGTIGRLYKKLGNGIFICTGALDVMASMISQIGLGLSAPSIYLMMRGFLIVIVAIGTVYILKRNIHRHQILGCILCIIGITIIGIISILHKAPSAINPALGITMILIAQIFNGLLNITQESFLLKIKIDPLLAIGIEGAFGVTFYIIWLPIFYFIPCNLDFCINGKLEDTVLVF